MARVLTWFLIFSFIMFSSFSSFSLANLGNETDRISLLAIKSQITRDPYQVLSSWNESNHFCKWEGVACGRRHQRVIELDLRSRGLFGSISPHIGNLSFLNALYIGNNSFYGEIPPQLSKLSRLEYLFLPNNSLAGNIPVNISLLSKLVHLHLNGNNLVGKIPTEIGSLGKLINLNFFSNQLTGEIPQQFGNLTSIRVLNLGVNDLTGNIPSTIGQLENLTFLSLVVNKLSGIVPSSIFNLSSLSVIAIAGNHLTGTLPVDIGHTLPNLGIFFIAGNQFSGSIPISLFNSTKLEKVDMSQNQFTGTIPLTLGNLQNLSLLNLENNSLGSGKPGDLNFVTSLTNCSNLNVLSVALNRLQGELPTSVGNLSKLLSVMYFEGNKISGNIPTEIENLRDLISLSLGENFFTGYIPQSFRNMKNLQVLTLGFNQLSGNVLPTGNMSSLFVLSLRNNLLEGTISPALENQNLQEISLSNNNFSGTISKEIGQSSNLRRVELTDNLLSGSIPVELGNLNSLNYFAISRNNMSGEVPKSVTSCSSLQYLYLDGNFFQGPLPSSMKSLVDLRILDVSSNKLSGNIPKELEKLSSLVHLNFSFNDFEGEIPTEGIFLNATAFSIAGNPRICGDTSKLHLPKCNIQKSNSRENKLTLKVILGVLLPVLVVGFVLVIFLKIKSHSKTSSEQSSTDHKRVSFIDLYRATNGFSSENLIGTGRYGFVYKGVHRQGELIAVKVLNLVESKAIKTFIAECEALRVIRHRNLLKILTICSSIDFNGNDFKALVFEFMHNGSLDSWLHLGSDTEHEQRYLKFHQRLNIAIDIASTLDYLHNHCEIPIIHCDLKPSNVLLGDELTAHVGDFGLAKFLSVSNATDTSTIAVRGTVGYIPPEYGVGDQVSTQGDVYSYGILLLEMFTGKRPTDPVFKDGVTLHTYSQSALPHHVMDIIDRSILSEIQNENTNTTNQLMKESLNSLVKIGVGCSLDVMPERLSIKTVLKELNSIKHMFSSYSMS